MKKTDDEYALEQRSSWYLVNGKGILMGTGFEQPHEAIIWQAAQRAVMASGGIMADVSALQRHGEQFIAELVLAGLIVIAV